MTHLEALCRAEWGHLLSALIRSAGDFDLAEEALQDAFEAAAAAWSNGVPRNPRGWLYATARHKAIDRLRKRSLAASRQHELEAEHAERSAAAQAALALGGGDEEASVPDERLRLIFTCCHPALAADAQVALTLRTLCGLSTDEIARAFLVPQPTMAQRLVRAKAKIRDAGIPYRVPAAEELGERLGQAMSVIYLVFNEGYAASQGEALVRRELCAEAIRLARLLRALMPAPVAEVDALLALLLLTDSRREARVDARGDLVLLPDQDRARWDRAEIDEARALLREALRRGPPGSYALEAAISAVHADAARAEDTDWRQIALLYERLLALHDSPVVALNHAVAVSMADGPHQGLPLLEALSEPLAAYHLWHAARGDLLSRLERIDEARAAYVRARALSRNAAEQRFLARRIEELGRKAPEGRPRPAPK